jgi:hypothetical protein
VLPPTVFGQFPHLNPAMESSESLSSTCNPPLQFVLLLFVVLALKLFEIADAVFVDCGS